MAMFRCLFLLVLIPSSAGIQLRGRGTPHNKTGACGFVLDVHDAGMKAKIPAASSFHESSATCFGMEFPPYFNSGSLDEGFNSSYPFTTDEVSAFPAEGNYDKRFKQAFDKLVQTKSLSILVLGGSETAGVGCRQLLEDGRELLERDCAWSSRLKHILEASAPGTSVNLINLAHGGTTTSVIVGGIGLVLKSIEKTTPLDTIDFVFIDTLVNDAAEAKLYGAQNLQLSADKVVSIAYEKLVRVLSTSLPRAMIFSLITGCPRCKDMAPNQQKIIDHYKLAHFDYGAVVAGKQNDSRLWDPPEPHPNWMAHQLMADMIAGVWKKKLDETCALLPTSKFFPDASLWQPEDLDVLPSCVDPLSGISAFEEDAGANRPTIVNGWTLFEDRPGKPGWISENQGSTMRVMLKFGKDPKLVVQYLRSYESLGNAYLRMNGHEVMLQGLWGDDNPENVSQSFVGWFDAGVDVTQGMGTIGQDGFGIAPHASAELEIVSDSAEKFKIIEISSC